MKTKQFFLNSAKAIGAFMLLTVMSAGLVACSDDNKDNAVVDITDADGTAEDFTPEILFHGKAYIADGVDYDLKQALAYGIEDVNGTVDGEDTRIIVLSKITDLTAEQLEKAFNMGKSIAIAEPDSIAVKEFVESHDWIDFNSANVRHEEMLFSFNRHNMYSHIHQPHYHHLAADGLEVDSEEDGDPIHAHMTKAKTNYVYLSTWLAKLQDRYNVREHPTSSSVPRRADQGSVDIEKFGNYYHASYTKPWHVHHKFRKVTWSSPDYMDGDGSMTVAYDIYMAHVYEGQPGAGDYYAVNMTASVANAGMWNGKGWNRHGGVYVRWCGWYCTDFWVESYLGNMFLRYEPAQFTAQATPSPQTTIGATSYTKSHTFSIGGSVTAGGQKGTGVDANGGQTSSASKSGSLTVNANWSWTKSESRSISDIDIQNQAEGNEAKWKVLFNNLPKYSGGSISYDIGNSQAYRATIELATSWMWYDPTGKDNDDGPKPYIFTEAGANYEMQSFISTGADNKKDEYTTGPLQHIFFLPKMVNTTVCGIELNNNLDSGTYITNVQVKDADDGTVYDTFSNSITTGDKVLLGWFVTTKNYTVTFDAKKPADAGYKHYAYTLNSQIPLRKTATVTLNAASDFTAQ